MPERTPLYDVTSGAGAVFAEDAGWLMPAHYGDAVAEYRQTCEQAGLFDLSHRGKIKLTGRDALSFLHNLCTNDIKNLPAGAGREAFLCNAQARVVAHLLAHRVSWQGEDALWLDVAPGLAEKVCKHLNHYLISEEVESTDCTREYAHLHLAGPQALHLLERAHHEPVKPLQELENRVWLFDGTFPCQLRRHDALGLPGYDLVFPAVHAGQVWSVLAQAGARPTGLEAYEILRVEAGTPVYGKDIDESNLAPEVGRTAQAVCYTKGCYLGQEPIVRIRDLGHVNRLLLGLKVAGAGPVPQGARLLRDGKEAGQVASSVVSPRLRTTIALAYVRRGSHTPGTRLEVEAEGSHRTADVVSLPFSGLGSAGG
jgi:folate-binding protein YgfZ